MLIEDLMKERNLYQAFWDGINLLHIVHYEKRKENEYLRNDTIIRFKKINGFFDIDNVKNVKAITVILVRDDFVQNKNNFYLTEKDAINALKDKTIIEMQSTIIHFNILPVIINEFKFSNKKESDE